MLSRALFTVKKREGRGRALAAKLKEVFRANNMRLRFRLRLGGKVVARETVGALRKDVTAKCYGGDITRNAAPRKAKGGQKRMKSSAQSTFRKKPSSRCSKHETRSKAKVEEHRPAKPIDTVLGWSLCLKSPARDLQLVLSKNRASWQRDAEARQKYSTISAIF